MHFPVNASFGYLQLLAPTKLLSAFLYRFVRGYIYFLFLISLYLGVELFHCRKEADCSFQSWCTILHVGPQWVRVVAVPRPCQHLVLSVWLGFLCSGESSGICQWGFTFGWWLTVLSPLWCAYLKCLTRERVLKALSIFSAGLFVSLLWTCRRSFYILTQVACWIDVLQTISISLPLLVFGI